MSLNHPYPHEGYVPSYQASSSPFVTSSLISVGEVHTIVFPQVTRFFNVQNTAAGTTDEIAVAFTENGLLPVNSNYFTLAQGAAFRDEIKCIQLFVSCTNGTNVRYQVVAGLTNIPAKQFLNITASNGFSGVG